MLRRALAAAAGLAGMLAAVAAAAGDVVMRGIALEPGGAGLQLTLDTDRPAAFRLFTLADPWRVVVDFPESDWRVAPLHPAALPDGAADLRFGLFRPGVGRLVLELDRPMRVTAAVAGETRFTLTLVPETAEAFAAAAGWPEGARWAADADARSGITGEGPVIVAIDPGHGGVDPGATVEGVVEKDVVLAFARVLAARLVASGRFRVFLTRERDIFVPLGERVRRARAAGANVLLSFHADIVIEGDARGSSVYTLPDGAVDEEAARLALEHERADVLVGADLAGEGDVLTGVLVELAQRGTQIESNRLAGALMAALEPVNGLLRSHPHRAVPFRVLTAPDTPSVLVELGYLSNARDRRRLTDPDWQARLADAILAALDTWAEDARPDFLRPRIGD